VGWRYSSYGEFLRFNREQTEMVLFVNTVVFSKLEKQATPAPASAGEIERSGREEPSVRRAEGGRLR
jgi:hypothetical protein